MADNGDVALVAVAKSEGKLVRRRAWESVKVSALGAAELVAGVGVHYLSAAAVEWIVQKLGHDPPDAREQFMVLGLQWAAALAFLIHGVVNIALGVGLAVRSAYRDWKD